MFIESTKQSGCSGRNNNYTAIHIMVIAYNITNNAVFIHVEICKFTKRKIPECDNLEL